MKALKWAGLALFSAVVSHIVILLYTPTAIMAVAHTVLDWREGSNRLVISEQPVHGKDEVVRSSPDLLYSVCAFDLDDGPVEIKAPASDSYFSISVFAANTDNIFAANDRQSPRGFHIILAEEGQNVKIPAGAEPVLSSSYGLVLFRYYVGGRKAEAFDELRKRASCGLLKK